MKVALTFPGCHRRGGVERVMLECANFLGARGHDVHVCASEWAADGIHPAVRRHQVTAARRPNFARIVTFALDSRKLLKSIQPDALGSFGVQCPTGGVFWVGSVHQEWLNVSRKRRNLAGRLKQQLNAIHPLIIALERRHVAERRYKKLVAMSPEIRTHLVANYRVPADDVELVPNGFSPSEFNPASCFEVRDALRSRFGYSPTDRVILFVANEIERKGFRPLIRAVKELRDPSLRVLAVGRLNPDSCRSEIERLGLADKVRFAGPSSEVSQYYAAADLFALPTQYEAWGLVIVEALACGLPVLTSRLAGASVAVREGETGELLEDPDAVPEITQKLGRLLARPLPSRSEISDSVRDYRWERVLPRYEQVLLESTHVGCRG